MTKYKLTVDIQSNSRLTTWDMNYSSKEMLDLCLKDVLNSDLIRFKLERVDGPPIELLIENCIEIDMTGMLT